MDRGSDTPWAAGAGAVGASPACGRIIEGIADRTILESPMLLAISAWSSTRRRAAERSFSNWGRRERSQPAQLNLTNRFNWAWVSVQKRKEGGPLRNLRFKWR